MSPTPPLSGAEALETPPLTWAKLKDEYQQYRDFQLSEDLQIRIVALRATAHEDARYSTVRWNAVYYFKNDALSKGCIEFDTVLEELAPWVPLIHRVQDRWLEILVRWVRTQENFRTLLRDMP